MAWLLLAWCVVVVICLLLEAVGDRVSDEEIRVFWPW